MYRKNINVGTSVNARNGDGLRDAFIKINSNFEELYSAISVLGSFTDDAEALITNIQGDVFSTSGEKLIDVETGKLASSALPDEVPKTFSIIVDFNVDGLLNNVLDIPTHWNYVINGDYVTIQHTVEKPPHMVVFWGHTSEPDELTLRFPSSDSQVSIPVAGINSVFTLRLNAIEAGSAPNNYAIIKVTF